MGWFVGSCSSSQSTAIPITTSTMPETATPTQLMDRLTPEIMPTLNNTPDKKGGIIVTLGEIVGRQGYWPAIPAFSPDGKMLALVSESVTLWDVETHELIHELVKPYLSCYTENAIFSSDSTLLAASIYCIRDQNPTGYVLIWDAKSGVLLHDWEQAFSKDTSESDELFNRRPATGIAFLPASSILAFANGNTIEMKDVQTDSKSIVFELGDEMFASDIAISEDGKRLFAFMDFSYAKSGNEVGQKYALQVWDLNSKSVIETTNFPEPGHTGIFYGHFDIEMSLLDTNLISIDYVNQVFMVTNLETGNIRNSYYLGDVETFMSQDANYVVSLDRLCKTLDVELWDTQFNQNLYTFRPFITGGCHSPHTIVFSPDNNMLAITHRERVSLWDISSFTKAKESGTP